MERHTVSRKGLASETTQIRVPVPVLPVPVELCGLGQVINLSEPHFPPLKNKNTKSFERHSYVVRRQVTTAAGPSADAFYKHEGRLPSTQVLNTPSY